MLIFYLNFVDLIIIKFKIEKVYKIWLLVSIVLISLLITPIISLLSSSFSLDSSIWEHIFENQLLNYLTNTLLIILPVSLLSLLISFFSAYTITFYNIKFRKIFDLLLLFPLAIPSYIMTYTYSNFFSYSGDFYAIQELFGLTNSKFIKFNFFHTFNLILILTFSLFPYLYIALRVYFSSIPQQLLNTITSLKLSQYKSITNILLPLSRPAIIGGLFLIIMELLNEYGAVKYFGLNTFTVGIFKVWLGMGSLDSALNLSFYLFLFVCLLFAFDYFLRKNKNFEFKRTNKEQILKQTSKLYSIIIFSFLFLITFLSFILPFLLIVKNSLSLSDYSYYSEIFTLTLNSFLISIATSFLIVVISIILIYSNRLNNFGLMNLITKVSTSGYAIPGAVIAISCIVVFNFINNNFLSFFSESINNSIYLLIFALIIRFIAVSFNTINGGFESLGSEYDKTYRSLGYSPLKSLLKINLPLLKKVILSAFILTFVDITKELPLTLILRPFNFDTLATRTFDFAGDEMLREASLPALIIIIIGIIPILFFNKLKK